MQDWIQLLASMVRILDLLWTYKCIHSWKYDHESLFSSSRRRTSSSISGPLWGHSARSCPTWRSLVFTFELTCYFAATISINVSTPLGVGGSLYPSQPIGLSGDGSKSASKHGVNERWRGAEKHAPDTLSYNLTPTTARNRHSLSVILKLFTNIISKIPGSPNITIIYKKKIVSIIHILNTMFI